jgi:hypothetical protein
MEIAINRQQYRTNRALKQSQATPEMTEAGGYYGNSMSRGMPPAAANAGPPRRAGFRSMFHRDTSHAAIVPKDPNTLPSHPRPSDMTDVPIMGEVRDGLISSDELAFNDGSSFNGTERPPPVRITTNTAPRPAAGEYHEGEVSPETYLPTTEAIDEQAAKPMEKGNKKKRWRKDAVDKYTNS